MNSAAKQLLLCRRCPAELCAALELASRLLNCAAACADMLPANPCPHLQTVLADGQVVWSGPVFLKGRYWSLGLTGGAFW